MQVATGIPLVVWRHVLIIHHDAVLDVFSIFIIEDFSEEGSTFIFLVTLHGVLVYGIQAFDKVLLPIAHKIEPRLVTFDSALPFNFINV